MTANIRSANLLCLLLAWPVLAGTPLPFNPQAGETVVFLGDSITHQSLYPQYLENFFITRHPERRIRFRNAGVAGDAAADAIARFDDDVAVHSPDYVTVHLGMNDGRYQDFDSNNLTAYRRGMQKLVERIESLDAKPILLSPTMFDHRVARMRSTDETWRFRGKEISTNYNALLGYFTGWGMETASRHDVPFVNWWGPLNRHTTRQRRDDPKFNLIWDAIHPNPSGQVIMACEFLLQLGVERTTASSITIRKQGGRWHGSAGVTNLHASAETGEFRFSHLADAIPWVIPEKHSAKALKWQLPSDGRRGFGIAGAGPQLSADRVTIANLPPGDYELIIDGQEVGVWNNAALGAGVELQENEKTPQFQQALRVAHLNRARHDQWVRPARDLAGRIKGLRRRGVAREDERIRTIHEQIAELTTRADQALAAIYTAAQPVERRWRLRRIAE